VQEYLLKMFIKMVMERLTPELLKEWVDSGLDYIEEAVETSETQIDDVLVLPVINLIRTAFDVPDNDEEN